MYASQDAEITNISYASPGWRPMKRPGSVPHTSSAEPSPDCLDGGCGQVRARPRPPHPDPRNCLTSQVSPFLPAQRRHRSLFEASFVVFCCRINLN